MDSVVLVIHLFLALSIVGLVLLQRSEGGGLGIGGGGGGLGGLAGAQSTANFLTKATTICAIAFFCTSLALGILARSNSTVGTSILDSLDTPAAATQSVIDAPEIGITGESDAPAAVPDVPSAP